MLLRHDLCKSDFINFYSAPKGVWRKCKTSIERDTNKAFQTGILYMRQHSVSAVTFCLKYLSQKETFSANLHPPVMFSVNVCLCYFWIKFSKHFNYSQE